MTCIVEDCTRPVRTRGMCQAHYRRQRAFETGERINNAAGTDLVARVVTLRLGVEAASARITQALLLLEDPDLIPRTGRTPAELLRDALTELDNARNR